MIIGHVGVAFAATRLWRRDPPVVWLLVATMAPDIWRLVLEATRYRPWHANMYSHSLPWSAIIAVVLASTAWTVTGDGKTAITVALLVVSHVGLDLLSGWKPLWIGGPHGLDMQHVEQLEFSSESLLACLGWRVMRRAHGPGLLASWVTLVLLMAAQGWYAASYYRTQPVGTQCLTYPVSPCWTRL